MGNRFIGVQIGPQSLLDEGVDHCLDLLQETAGVNALLVYSHSYYGAQGRPPEVLAPDHGVPVLDERNRNLTKVWVNHHESAFKGTFLRHPHSSHQEYGDRDIMEELLAPARKRGMKVLTRFLEPCQQGTVLDIPNWVKILSTDVYGRLYPTPCWNHPDYRNFWLSTTEDLFRSYPLDGMQYGAERVGPLSNVLLKGQVPACFCQHCCDRAGRKGINSERARTGYRKLYEFIKGQEDGQQSPTDGNMTEILRTLFKYPEILSWEYEFHQAREDMTKLLYGAVKALRPDALFGVHIDHQQSTWDIFQRAEIEYAEVAGYCDFVKPILYHDIAGPRIRRWHLDKVKDTVFREVTLEQSLDLFYDFMGLDKKREPDLDSLDTTGFSPDYVYRMTRRLVEGVDGKALVYPGIGFDIPWNNRHFPSNPATIQEAIVQSFRAGAQGIVLSREYGEMRLESLKAVGRAVRSLGGEIGS